MSDVAQRIVDFHSALEIVLREAASFHMPGTESVALLASQDRMLAEVITADRDQPPFDRATRDGFAVHAAEWSSGMKLRVVGEVRAGEMWNEGEFAGGEAVEIMTGAPVPEGADAVAMVEHAEQSGDEVWVMPGRTLRSGENIVSRGSEARAGDVLLKAGVMMSAAEIALAAACGRSEISVYQRPRVAILSTGDELVEIGEAPAPHQIRNSNSYALAALVAAAGGESQRLSITRDSRVELRASIDEGRDADLLLLSGGVSAGKYDLVEEVLVEFGATFLFTGVKMQPGRPIVFGRMPRKGKSLYFFGLPGNPISTQVTFHCFVEPLLRALCGAGADDLMPKAVQATLTSPERAKPGLTRLLPARLIHNLDKPEVLLVSWQGSGDLVANARANCYAVLPDGHDLRTGDVVTILLR